MKFYQMMSAVFLILFTLNANSESKVAQAQSIVRIPLLTVDLQTEKLVKKVEIKRIDFSPLQKTGLHFHPLPVVGYVAKGTIYFQLEGEAPKILKTGDAFFEPENAKILHFDNSSETQQASFIAIYLLSKDDKEIIKMLK